MDKTLNPEFLELYNDFLSWQKLRVTESTYYTRKSLAYRVLKWFENENIRLLNATVSDMLRYKEVISGWINDDGEPLKAGTINQYLNITRLFFHYLILSGRRKSNPMKDVPLLQEPFQICKNYLTETQMSLLLTKLMYFDEAKDMVSKRRRYRVHVAAEVLYATGLRQHELVTVEEQNINLHERTIYITEGKGGINRTVFLTGYAMEILDIYLKKGRAAAIPGYLDKGHNERVFGSWLGDAVNTELHQICNEIGIPVITCHGFRHSLGTHLLRAGCDIRHIQAILGHSNISSTTTYTHVDKDELKRNLDKYHPRQCKRSNEMKEVG